MGNAPFTYFKSGFNSVTRFWKIKLIFKNGIERIKSIENLLLTHTQGKTILYYNKMSWYANACINPFRQAMTSYLVT